MTRAVVMLLLSFINRLSTCWRRRGDEGAETILEAREKRKRGEEQHGIFIMAWLRQRRWGRVFPTLTASDE